MKDFKGTQGEWYISHHIDESCSYAVFSTHEDRDIDTDICKQRFWAPSNRAEHMANATLIAAAPDLLKACMETLEFLNGMDNPRQESINAQIDTLQSAITKALTI